MNQLSSNKNKEVILFIDTSSNKQISIGVGIDGNNDMLTEAVGRNRAQAVLPLMDQLLNKHGLQPTDITAIEVNKGPGSFTGVRVGVSIANTLGYGLGIPVNKKKSGIFVEPEY